jgi:hypothetical protein
VIPRPEELSIEAHWGAACGDLGRRAYFPGYSRLTIRQGREDGVQNTYVYVVCPERWRNFQLVMREGRVWRFFELYVYTLGGSQDRREGNDAQGKAMRHLRVLRAMVLTLAFFIAQPLPA